MLVGLVLDRDGFPKAYEVFEGNRKDRTTVGEMLDRLEKCTGAKPGSTVVVDRGIAYEENLADMRSHGYRYLVAGRQPERNAWLGEFQAKGDWEEVSRAPSPRNPSQEKSPVRIKRGAKGDEVSILCVSKGRQAKQGYLVGLHRRNRQEVYDYLRAAEARRDWQECPPGIAASERSTPPRTRVVEIPGKRPGPRVTGTVILLGNCAAANCTTWSIR